MAKVVAKEEVLESIISDIYKVRSELWNEYMNLNNKIVKLGNERGGWNDQNYTHFSAEMDAALNKIISAFDDYGPFKMFEKHLANLNQAIGRYKSKYPTINIKVAKKNKSSY